MSFSGYLLPWDQLAYWAVTIGANIASSAHELTDLMGITSFLDIGSFLKKILIGDDMVGQAALTRFFAMHIFFLPVTFIILTSVHLWRIRKDGGLSRPALVSRAPSTEKPGFSRPEDTQVKLVTREKTEKWYSWPIVPWIELGIFLLLIAVLLLISTFADAPLMERANPNLPENPAKSPWYFLGIQELVSYSAFTGGILIPILFLVFLISIPFIDREKKYSGYWFSGKEGLHILLGAVLLGAAITILNLFIYVKFGWLRDWFPGLSQVWVLIFNPASLMAFCFIFYSLWVRKRKGSNRMGAIALFSCAMTAFLILTVVGIWFRGPNWEFYWSSAQWPKI